MGAVLEQYWSSMGVLREQTLGISKPSAVCVSRKVLTPIVLVFSYMRFSFLFASQEPGSQQDPGGARSSQDTCFPLFLPVSSWFPMV